jgi:4'-phosphopantetheinyl transferase
MQYSEFDCRWMRPAPDMYLLEGDVHVWRVRLDEASARVRQYMEILSAEERAKAERFRFARHCRRYIVSHAILRIILGRFYLNVDPHKLEFGQGEHGKPHVANHFPERKLYFNLATSHELALYALTRSDEIGVDVEFQRELRDAEEIAARYFAVGEIAALRSLPGETKPEGFYNCWTRKEAFIKAVGKGLSFPLDQFEVSLAPGESARIISIEGDADQAKHWTLKSLNPGQGYFAALAVRKLGVNLTCWQFPASGPGTTF